MGRKITEKGDRVVSGKLISEKVAESRGKKKTNTEAVGRNYTDDGYRHNRRAKTGSYSFKFH